MMWLIGAHANGEEPLAEIAERDADLIQFFLSDPQGWKKPPPRDDAAELVASGARLYIHAPYLMNLASPNNRIRIPSRKNLAQTVEAAEAIGAAGVIVHGGHVGDDEDISVGYERWRKALDTFESNVPVLIENTAGGGNAVVRDLENYAPLWEEIGDYNVGTVLDTCHAWAGGSPLETAAQTVIAGAGQVDLVHCNDSRDPFDSRRDRHANLGAGEIPADLLVACVAAAQAPIVVETPGGPTEHKTDIAWLRERLG
jgi:deoxyribonuclease-4